MERSSLRIKYHLLGSAVVVVTLAAIQYWQDTIDWGYLLVVAIGYVILRVTFDALRSRV